MALLLYPCKGNMKEVKRNRTTVLEPVCKPLYEALNDEGIELFRQMFNNNNSILVNDFFKHSFFKKLAPLIQAELTYEHCFKASPNASIRKTYKYIYHWLASKYNFILPEWWVNKCF